MNATKNRWWGLLAMTAAVTGVIFTGAAAQGENLLTNPGFEAPYAFIQDDAVRQVAQGWSAWYMPAPAGAPVSQLVQPEYYAASDVENVLGVARIRSGADAQHLASFYATFEGGVFQTVFGVTPGQDYAFSAYSYAWSSSLENVDLSEQGSAVFVQVGIDPLAGVDPSAASVVWSEAGPATLDAYTQHSVTAAAQGDSLTAFIRVLTETPVKNTAVFLDDAQLAAAVDSAAVIPDATTEAEATDESVVVAEPTEDVIVAEPTEESAEVVVVPEASPESEVTAGPDATEAVVVPAETEAVIAPTQEIAPTVTEVATEAVAIEVTEVATEEVSAEATEAATDIPQVTPAEATPVSTEIVLPEVTSETTADAPVFEATAEAVVVQPTTDAPVFEATAEAVAAQPTADFFPTQEFFEPSAVPSETAVPTQTAIPTETLVPTASNTPSPVPTLDLTAYPGRFFYTVQAGDNVGRIAQVFNTSVEAILAANGLTVESIIYVNQQLTIPVNLPFVQPTDVLLVTPTPTVDPAAPTAPPPTPVPPTTGTYRVGYGENLTYIAFRFGTTVRALARLNNISNPNLIYPGQLLIVPVNQGAAVPTPITITELQGQAAQEPTTYRVQRGDNLYNIALRFNIPLASLIQSNGILNANRIYVGQVLIIP
ncbi:MAG: LysM peptidoglycan-binding domain-containing protein [Pleurocapsa minor GSE-CHR-MK-17-07R]|jgi:LysM repeat protein|nr:LysM peptidoglycan-binding domain-containing protein [Pleurocapsa minor GSE-CHR-MK 17-07R]